VTTKLAYEAIVGKNLTVDKEWWYLAPWRIKIPTKLILFVWICLMNKILTGENFRLRGGTGSSVCTLCLENEETT